MKTTTVNIQVNFQQIKDAVKQLTAAEKSELSELIWEDDMVIPVEVQNLVLDRLDKGLKDPKRLLNWDEVSKEL